MKFYIFRISRLWRSQVPRSFNLINTAKGRRCGRDSKVTRRVVNYFSLQFPFQLLFFSYLSWKPHHLYLSLRNTSCSLLEVRAPPIRSIPPLEAPRLAAHYSTSESRPIGNAVLIGTTIIELLSVRDCRFLCHASSLAEVHNPKMWYDRLLLIVMAVELNWKHGVVPILLEVSLKRLCLPRCRCSTTS